MFVSIGAETAGQTHSFTVTPNQVKHHLSWKKPITHHRFVKHTYYSLAKLYSLGHRWK
jgi:hypothetical protein